MSALSSGVCLHVRPRPWIPWQAQLGIVSVPGGTAKSLMALLMQEPALPLPEPYHGWLALSRHAAQAAGLDPWHVLQIKP